MLILNEMWVFPHAPLFSVRYICNRSTKECLKIGERPQFVAKDGGTTTIYLLFFVIDIFTTARKHKRNNDMASKVDVNIDFAQTQLSEALDHYYSFVKKIVANDGGVLSPNQRLALTNTITSIGFLPKKKYYNTQLFRSFADLTVLDGHDPKKSGSPIEGAQIDNIIGSPDISSAWSSEFAQVALPYTISKVKDRLTADEKLQVDNLEKEFDTAYDDYLEELDKLEDGWSDYVDNSGINPDDDDYWVKYRKWWSKRNRKLARKLNKAQLVETDIEVELKKSATPESLWLLPIRNQLLDVHLVPLPVDPELEEETTANVQHRPGFWDVRPSIRPPGLGDYDLFLKETASDDSAEKNESEDKDQTDEQIEDTLNLENGRSYHVSSGAQATYQHDVDWKTTAKTGYGFFSGSVSVGKQEHFNDAATKLKTLSVGFRRVDEMIVVRDRWFSRKLLNDSEFLDYLKDKSPKSIYTLSNCVVSLIVARGLCLRLTFDEDYSSTEWEKLQVSGSAGISVGGWSFGLKGHYNESEHWTTTRDDKNSITFIDKLDVCRVIGFRVENLIDKSDEENAGVFGTLVSGEVSVSERLNTLEQSFREGKIDYLSFLDAYNDVLEP